MRSPGTLPLLLFTAMLAGCGYRPITGTVPGGGKAICVPLVRNQTPYADLAAPLTTAIRHRLARSGLHVVSAREKTPRLLVTITEVKGEPGMLGIRDNSLVPLDNIWSIRVQAEIRGANGVETSDLTELMAQGRAFAGDNVNAEEALGQRRRQTLLDDLADQIAEYLFERRGA